jgi:RNase P/RNase MRP subunit POP5
LKRFKRRYLALQLDSDVLPNGKEFIDTIWGAVTKLYGEEGASQTSLMLIEYDLEKKTALLRTSLITLDLVKASLATITSIAGKEAAVHITAVSGTIKALHQKTR